MKVGKLSGMKFLGGLGKFIFLLLFLEGCFIEPFSLKGYPCTSNDKCAEGEICVRGICRNSLAEAGECDKDSDCPCSKKCDTKKKKCFEPVCQKSRDCRCGWICNVETQRCEEPPNTKPCKDNNDCLSRHCIAGHCEPPCRSDLDCKSEHCNNGYCEPCKKGDECLSGLCRDGECVPCQKNEECESGLCKKHRCIPCASHSECPTGRCVENKCLPCHSGKECFTGLCIENKCVPCQKAEDCPSGRCTKGRCEPPCQKAEDCPKGLLCQKNRCVPCQKAEDCPSLRCSDGLCLGPCQSDLDCRTGRFCQKGRCELPFEGMKCNPLLGCQDTLLCVRENNENRCRQPCDPLSASSCSKGKGCAILNLKSSSQKGVCLDYNNGGQVGDPCSTERPCEVNLVCRFDGKDRLCRKICNLKGGHCAKGEQCLPINPKDSHPTNVGLCLPPTCETLPNGCEDPSSICFQTICHKKCSPKDPKACSKEQVCYPLSATQAICREKECGYRHFYCPNNAYCENYICKDLASPPKACSLDKNCPSGQLCVKQHCLTQCNPSSKNPCKKGFLCVPDQSHPSRFICAPRRGAGLSGDPCDLSKYFCEWSHVCIVFKPSSICLQACDPSSKSSAFNGGCPKSYKCQRLKNSSLGICYKTTIRTTNAECGPLTGECAPLHSCIYSLKDKKAYCRKHCSFSCPKGYTCSRVQGAHYKVCLPKS